jgi:hypothetical protein
MPEPEPDLLDFPAEKHAEYKSAIMLKGVSYVVGMLHRDYPNSTQQQRFDAVERLHREALADWKARLLEWCEANNDG